MLSTSSPDQSRIPARMLLFLLLLYPGMAPPSDATNFAASQRERNTTVKKRKKRKKKTEQWKERSKAEADKVVCRRPIRWGTEQGAPSGCRSNWRSDKCGKSRDKSNFFFASTRKKKKRAKKRRFFLLSLYLSLLP